MKWYKELNKLVSCVCIYLSLSSSFFLKNIHFFHAKLGLDVCRVCSVILNPSTYICSMPILVTDQAGSWPFHTGSSSFFLPLSSVITNTSTSKFQKSYQYLKIYTGFQELITNSVFSHTKPNKSTTYISSQ